MSETTFEQRVRDQHAADPKSMMFAGHALIALDELRSQLAAESQLKEAAEKERDYYKAGYNQSPVSAKACPGCVYENGKFVRECGLHKRLCDERDGRNAAEARAAGLTETTSELIDCCSCLLLQPDNLGYQNDASRAMDDCRALLAPAAEEAK
jgi:hypothetical protein